MNSVNHWQGSGYKGLRPISQIGKLAMHSLLTVEVFDLSFLVSTS